MDFLAHAIVYANQLEPSNWNLNLDKNGEFIRLNTGHEYCIEVFKGGVLILCLRRKLRSVSGLQLLPIKYLGYTRKRKVISENLDDVPDCLARVPDSVGCLIQHDSIPECVSRIRDCNHAFIKVAIGKRLLLPAMRNAHSDGMIDYMSFVLQRRIPKPKYRVTDEEYYRETELAERVARQLSDSDLQRRIAESVRDRRLVDVTTTRYIRNPYVAEFARRRARGICQDCGRPAPFVAKNIGEPYLEVHHVVSLANGGEDVPDNVIALCPNCHRKRHYG